MELLRAALSGPSMQHLLQFHIHCVGPNPLWTVSGCSVMVVKGATIRARLATSSYLQQTRRTKFSKSEPDPTCQLCKGESKDAMHFLDRCLSLLQMRDVRDVKLQELGVPLPVLDWSQFALSSQWPLQVSEILSQKVNWCANLYCLAIHKTRLQLLELEFPCKPGGST